MILIATGSAAVRAARAQPRGARVPRPADVPPRTGPWVAIAAPTAGGLTVVWEIRCPLAGYIVGGIDARVSTGRSTSPSAARTAPRLAGRDDQARDRLLGVYPAVRRARRRSCR